MIITASNLYKQYGSKVAVDELSFQVQPGRVTGFLGPNGSGKSTTMRLMLDLDHGRGQTLWDGKPLHMHPDAPAVVGAHLDAKFFHPNRTAKAHLNMLAAASGVSKGRVSEVIETMGLSSVAKKRPKGFSMGMGQRLGLASAILAEPSALLLDEPANGLDPQSIHWLRDYLRHYAQQGRTVFVSSHLLSEIEVMADHVVVIAKGRLIADEPLAEFVERSVRNDVFIRCAEPDRLADALRAELGPAAVTAEPPDAVAVTGTTTDYVGMVAHQQGIAVLELTKRTASLEQAFLELTSGAQEYQLGSGQGGPQ